MFSTDSYSTVRGVDKLIPVDVYLPGCPPKPEAIIDAVIKLRKKVAQEDIIARKAKEQTHRFYTRTHKFNLVEPVYTGRYLQMQERQSPPKEFSENLGIPTTVFLQKETNISE
jgi:NAD(P)H-quinone oxidoreductase subunit K